MRRLAVPLAFLLALRPSPGAAPQERAELVVTRAKLLTVDQDFRIVEAAAVRGGRFVAVGSDAEIRAWIGPGTRALDAGGRTVVPGLIESHSHASGVARSEAADPYEEMTSIPHVQEWVRRAAERRPAGAWIVIPRAYPTRLREHRFPTRAELDAACGSALSGPIRFNLNAGAGNGLLLPHLAGLKRLVQTLGLRAVLGLHDGNPEAAWTNLLAASRLVTAWDPEPVEISHLVRFACGTIACNATWQAFQADGWTDDRLTHLQREWELVDFFKGLPETAAFKRASMVATCQLERQQPISRPGIALNDVIHSPRSAWYGLTEYWRQLRYRRHGTYEDEQALLLHYRDRELELRGAAKTLTWSEMRQLPGVTNMIPFQSKYPSAMLTMMNMRQIALASHLYAQGQGPSWLGRAADAEARRYAQEQVIQSEKSVKRAVRSRTTSFA